jgi:putative lipoic acid-binding regulatory protein
MADSNLFDSLKSKLDEQYTWPSLYIFKFIVPNEKVNDVKALFPRHEVSTKPSSKGTYISVTAKIMAKSSEDIIEIYLKAQSVEGIISL